MKKKALIIVGTLSVAIIVIGLMGKYNSLEAVKVYKNSNFTIGIIKDIKGSTRSNFYYVEYQVNGLNYNDTEVTYKQTKEKDDKVLIMFNKNRPAKAFLFENTIIPQEFLNKDTIWTTPPDFINPEDLKFLED